ncbi:MAG: peptide-methionine (S)-S-oxide reductase MsrA [Gammaproteobacteria bacterium]
MRITRISSHLRSVAAVLLLAGGIVVPLAACAAEAAVVIPAAAMDNSKAKGPLQTAVVAGGCFWGVQGVFEHLSGVRKVVSGYAGGEKRSAQYETVSEGRSGHAESVEITFDPEAVTYGQILQVFFSVAHDPTQLNRQGPDSGTQYRSSIFFADDTQKKIALAYIAQLDKTGVYRRPIVTRVDALKGFYAAEGYHQDYLLNNPRSAYIVYNDLPKIRNFEQTLPQLYKTKATTVSGSER